MDRFETLAEEQDISMALVSSLHEMWPPQLVKTDQSTPAIKGRAQLTSTLPSTPAGHRRGELRHHHAAGKGGLLRQGKTTTKHEPDCTVSTPAALPPPRGHRGLLRRRTQATARCSGPCAREAERSGGESIVLSFDPHPRVTLGRAEGLQLLTTVEEKALLLERAGIDHWSSFRSTRHSAASRPTLSSVTSLIRPPGHRGARRGLRLPLPVHDQRGDTGCLDRPHRNRTARRCGSPNMPQRGQGKLHGTGATSSAGATSGRRTPPGSSSLLIGDVCGREIARRKPLAAPPGPVTSATAGSAAHR